LCRTTINALKRGAQVGENMVVDDEPVNWRDFTWALAGACDTPKPWELPLPVLRLVVPYLAVMMTSSLRVSNARARRELEWTPSMPTYRDGVRRMTTVPHEAA
jgi:nucleoside-diphosphate-sugar epimerase